MEITQTLAATGWSALSDTTKFFVYVMIAGVVIATIGVRRNEIKKKAGVAVFGLILAVGGAIAALYVK